MTRSIFAPFFLAITLAAPAFADGVQADPRPAQLIAQMQDGPLKDRLAACAGQPIRRTDFSIGHRGAPLHFAEHTVQSYTAAANLGAGIVECDVTFTADNQLVCRHGQDDLHDTTNILETNLAAKCTSPRECRSSDLTLGEFQTLTGTGGSKSGTLVSHAQSIALLQSLGVKFTPELKAPSVLMPHNGMTQEDYAQAMINDYKSAGIPARDVWPQSFNLEDILYWIKAEPAYGKQAVYLVSWSRGFDEQDPATWSQDFAALKSQGVNYLAPSINMLLTNRNGQIAASAYAVAARKAGLKLIGWSLERSGSLSEGGGWYYQSVKDLITSDGDMYSVIDALAQDAGVVGLFSDWPATTSYYASCMGLP